MRNYDEVILGGGLTGLSLASKFLDNNERVCLVEKEKNLGGLARSYLVEETIFDFGPHILRSNNKSIIQLARNLVQMSPYKSQAEIFKYGKLFDCAIPAISRKNIELLPEELRKNALKELKEISASQCKCNANFREVIEAQIGITLYDEFFGEYSAKWWGMPPEKLSATLAPKNLKIENEAKYAHITTAFNVPRKEFYPKKDGYGSLAKALERRIRRKNCNILNDNIIKFEVDGDRISNIVFEGEQEIKGIKGLVYSTIPITTLCELLGIRTTLRYRSDICVYVVSKHTGNVRKIPHSWLYFPESDFIFGRLSDTFSFSSYNSPRNKIGLCAEVTCFPEDHLWNDTYLPEKVIDHLIDLGFLNMKDLIGWHVVKEQYAYPLLTCDYKKEHETVKSKIEQKISNLVLAGRTGSFEYHNSDMALAHYFNT